MVAENVLSEATRRLVEQFHPRRVILFGSQARGTSDDILVLTPEEFERDRHIPGTVARDDRPAGCRRHPPIDSSHAA